MQELIIIGGFACLVAVWLFGNWVVRQDKKEGRESDNTFGM
jgi:hypothetical protein